jgi:uncharacterized protein with LGFP repeats
MAKIKTVESAKLTKVDLPLHVYLHPIAVKYSSLGGSTGWLGPALTTIHTCPDGVGAYQHYANGSIYWHPNTGAHEVHGLIRARWQSLGWEKSFLGYPLTDESTCPDGIGRYNHFQGGSIYWSPATGAWEVHGAIRAKYSQLGWEKSFLGYPLTNESTCPDGIGRYNHFQGGSIYWSPSIFTGALLQAPGKYMARYASTGPLLAGKRVCWVIHYPTSWLYMAVPHASPIFNAAAFTGHLPPVYVY